ncbi:MAG: RNA polymerase sigma-70 factor [Saprospiraceae bacterium]|nr:RNA polymerase sigma-70 factor [Saprospiraceae bacterium]
MSELDYNTLWSRICADEQSALKKLFQHQFGPVCQCIYRFVKDQDLARDLAQNVFIRLWEKRNSLQIQSSVPAYLRRMAQNEALAHLRSKKIFSTEEEEIPDQVEDTTPEGQFLDGELSHQIQRAIETLPPRCQIIFKLSRFEERSYKEIADELSLSVKTVENQMGKALKMLRSEMAPYLSDP